jgi:hypothetical protein
VQEKFRQASENLDSLNKWLDQVEREIAGQEVPREDSDQLRTQINTLKVRLSCTGSFSCFCLSLGSRTPWGLFTRGSSYPRVFSS